MSAHEQSDAAPDIRTLSVAEAAEALGFPEHTVRYFVSKRAIPYVKVGRLVRFRPADLEAFLSANTRPASRS